MMCGIVGILHAEPSIPLQPGPFAANELHEALYLLQHRGQDACVSCRSMLLCLSYGLRRSFAITVIL